MEEPRSFGNAGYDAESAARLPRSATGTTAGALVQDFSEFTTDNSQFTIHN
jgi:hypothetical protein